MSPRDRGGDWFDAPPKKPPPAHGIKMKKAGTTWSGQRWIEALQHVLRGDAGRLSRGRTYARAGRTHDLIVKNGKVTAKVTGSRPTPYTITIALKQFSEGEWQKVVRALAERAQFSAELLTGNMPIAIEEAFAAAALTLFPNVRADLVTTCSCPDWGDPCKHVAAAHYVLGEALDRDPFLLFELRGRSKEQVLDALRTARSADEESPRARTPKGQAGKTTAKETVGAAADVPRVTLGKLSASDYDSARAPLPVLHFSFDAPVSHGAVLRQLGSPSAWSGNASPAEALGPLVQAAAEAARRIALTDEPAGEADGARDEPPASPGKKVKRKGPR